MMVDRLRLRDWPIISFLYLRTRESQKLFDKRQELKEYAVILSVVAVVLFAHFATR